MTLRKQVKGKKTKSRCQRGECTDVEYPQAQKDGGVVKALSLDRRGRNSPCHREVCEFFTAAVGGHARQK